MHESSLFISKPLDLFFIEILKNKALTKAWSLREKAFDLNRMRMKDPTENRLADYTFI